MIYFRLDCKSSIQDRKKLQENIMGQYQQWLRYREIEQQLRAHIETLETELADLQARAHLLEETGSYEENTLLRLLMLAARLDSQPPAPVQESQSIPGSEANSSSSLSPAQGPAVGKHDLVERPALFTWNGLPDFSPPAVSATPQPPEMSGAIPSSPLPRPEIELLPEDMTPFFDERTQTAPQVQVPWWMRQPITSSAAGSIKDVQRNVPRDQGSMRNNRDIERWLERWGRQPANHEPQGDTHRE
jgi:hypothetical protein